MLHRMDASALSVCFSSTDSLKAKALTDGFVVNISKGARVIGFQCGNLCWRSCGIPKCQTLT
jgi:hypothetical protein